MAGNVTTAEGFAAWVRQLRDAEHVEEDRGIVPCTYLWITEGSRYVGAIAFRHHLTPALLNSGGPHRLRSTALGSWPRRCIVGSAGTVFTIGGPG